MLMSATDIVADVNNVGHADVSMPDTNVKLQCLLLGPTLGVASSSVVQFDRYCRLL